jgi:peptidoglycan/xylan/chitin deacetylase (PgdA/CDA1 family)
MDALKLRSLPLVLAVAIAWLVTSSALAADSAVVLMYHRFGEDRHPSTSIRIDQFEAQLEHLREGGYSVIPLAHLLAALEGDSTDLPDRAVVITIDDAYRSIYEIAFPRFKKYGYPFTVFVATDPVDGGLADYMTWEQMRELQEEGATFANHGAGHISLIEREDDESADAWRKRIGADVAKGRKRLDEELDFLSGAFAYPYGEYNPAVADMLAELGYVSFGQQSGAVGPLTDRRALPRYPMAEAFGDMAQFRTKVASLPMPVTAVDPWDPVTTNRQPSIVVTVGQTDAHLDELACFVSGQGRVEIEWLEAGKRFRVGAATPFEKGRQRVNCTAPTKSGRYQWFSHPWIIQ